MKSLLLALSAVSLLISSASAHNNENKQSKLDRLSKTKAPIAFVQNVGQIKDQYNQPRPDIQFRIAASAGLNVFIGSGAIHYQFSKSLEAASVQPNEAWLNPDITAQHPYAMYRMDVTLAGSNPAAKFIVEDSRNYKEHYFTDWSGEKGAVAHCCDRIRYIDVYPHIDWILYLKDGKIKHEFIVREGGEVTDIRLNYTGASSISIHDDGSLVARTPFGTISEDAPVSFDGNGRPVKSSFSLRGNELRYQCADYAGQLTIDPTVSWATYFGGSGNDYGFGLAVDASSNTYVSGFTTSTTNIATTGAHQTTIGSTQDSYLAKFNSSGVLQWATYYGGNGNEFSYNVEVDGSGNVYMVGITGSSGGIATTGAHQTAWGGIGDAFLAKFNSSGTLLWGTYYGGVADDNGRDVAVDGSGNVIISGRGGSTSVLASTGAHQTSYGGGSNDAFVAKFNSSGARQWGTLCGGNGDDVSYGVTVDGLGNIYITGWTGSSTNIATAGAHQTAYAGGTWDDFLVKFNTSGVRQWGTYYGGAGPDYGFDAVTDASGDVYIVGNSGSTTAIATSGAYQVTNGGGFGDIILVKFNSSGVRQWGTYYGGTGDDYGYSLGILSSGDIYVGGYTSSTSSIVTTGAIQASVSGNYDGYVSVFNNSGVLQWGTYFGGPGTDLITKIVPVASGDIYFSGETPSTSGIATTGAFQTTYGGGIYDQFTGKISYCTLTSSVVVSSSATTVCAGSTVTFTATPTNGGASPSYQWKVNGINAGTNSSTFSYAPANGDAVTVVMTSSLSCTSPVTSNAVSLTVTPTITPSVSISSSTNGICAGTTVTFTASPVNGGASPVYQWKVNGLNAGTGGSSFSYAPANGDIVSVAMTSNAVCPLPATVNSNNITMSVMPLLLPTATIATASTIVCTGSSVTYTSTITNAGSTSAYQWKVNGVNAGTNAASFTYTPANGDVVTLNLTSNATCASPATVSSNALTMTVSSAILPTATITTPSTTFCAGSSVTFTATNTFGGATPSYQWKVNSVNAGTGGTTFSYVPANGDIVSVVLTSSLSCASPASVSSNSITMNAVTNLTPAVSISTPATTSCSGTAVTFTATQVNGGAAPAFQWKVNGINVGTNSSTFSYTPTNGDAVTVVMTTSLTCASTPTATSNAISMTVLPVVVPTVSISVTPDSNICSPSASLTFTATALGAGSSPVYQWKKNGVSVGTGNAFYTNTAWSAGDVVSLTMSSTAACAQPATVNSNVITVHVSPPVVPSLSIFTLPDDTVCASFSGTNIFLVSAFSNPGNAPTYQWLINGLAVAGANSPLFNTTGMTNGDTVVLRMQSSATCATPDTIHSNPIVMTIIPSPVPVITNNSGILNAGISAAAYQWYYNGNEIAGATQSTFPLTGYGTYTVKVTTAYGCIGTSAPYNHQLLGVSGIGSVMGFILYPNPAHDKINLTLSGGMGIKPSDRISIQLTDVTGRIAFVGGASKYHNNIATFDLPELRAGVYVATCFVENLELKGIKVLIR